MTNFLEDIKKRKRSNTPPSSLENTEHGTNMNLPHSSPTGSANKQPRPDTTNDAMPSPKKGKSDFLSAIFQQNTESVTPSSTTTTSTSSLSDEDKNIATAVSNLPLLAIILRCPNDYQAQITEQLTTFFSNKPPLSQAILDEVVEIWKTSDKNKNHIDKVQTVLKTYLSNTTSTSTSSHEPFRIIKKTGVSDAPIALEGPEVKNTVNDFKTFSKNIANFDDNSFAEGNNSPIKEQVRTLKETLSAACEQLDNSFTAITAEAPIIARERYATIVEKYTKIREKLASYKLPIIDYPEVTNADSGTHERDAYSYHLPKNAARLNIALNGIVNTVTNRKDITKRTRKLDPRFRDGRDYEDTLTLLRETGFLDNVEKIVQNVLFMKDENNQLFITQSPAIGPNILGRPNSQYGYEGCHAAVRSLIAECWDITPPLTLASIKTITTATIERFFPSLENTLKEQIVINNYNAYKNDFVQCNQDFQSRCNATIKSIKKERTRVINLLLQKEFLSLLNGTEFIRSMPDFDFAKEIQLKQARSKSSQINGSISDTSHTHHFYEQDDRASSAAESILQQWGAVVLKEKLSQLVSNDQTLEPLLSTLHTLWPSTIPLPESHELSDDVITTHLNALSGTTEYNRQLKIKETAYVLGLGIVGAENYIRTFDNDILEQQTIYNDLNTTIRNIKAGTGHDVALEEKLIVEDIVRNSSTGGIDDITHATKLHLTDHFLSSLYKIELPHYKNSISSLSFTATDGSVNILQNILDETYRLQNSITKIENAITAATEEVDKVFNEIHAASGAAFYDKALSTDTSQQLLTSSSDYVIPDIVEHAKIAKLPDNHLEHLLRLKEKIYTNYPQLKTEHFKEKFIQMQQLLGSALNEITILTSEATEIVGTLGTQLTAEKGIVEQLQDKIKNMVPNDNNKELFEMVTMTIGLVSQLLPLVTSLQDEVDNKDTLLLQYEAIYNDKKALFQRINELKEEEKKTEQEETKDSGNSSFVEKYVNRRTTNSSTSLEI